MIHLLNCSVKQVICNHGLTRRTPAEARRLPALTAGRAGVIPLRRPHPGNRAHAERGWRTSPDRTDPGLSQRALADRLGAVPSRVVSLIDSLQARGLVERERSSTDRRIYELRLTLEGAQLLRRLREIAEAHDAELLAPLTVEQSAQLGSLLAQLAGANALDLDLHRDAGREDPGAMTGLHQ